MDKPVLRCLIARILGDGLYGRSQFVDIGTAYLAVKSKQWVCVGPDPEDQLALAAWEREQTPRPKWHR